jgi:uncharacterized membrane protein HdeD (DUF308 family)
MFFLPIGRKTWSPVRWGLLAAGVVSVALAGFLLYRYLTQDVLATQWLTSAMFAVFGLALLAIAFFAGDQLVKRVDSFFDA